MASLSLDERRAIIFGATSVYQRVAAFAAQTASAPDAEAAIRQAWPAQAEMLDLLEPFARIREALEEAQKSVRAAA